MKIAVTSYGPTIDDRLDERFRVARFVIIYDTLLQNFEQLKIFSSPKELGQETARRIIQAGAKALITGHIGNKAYSMLYENQIVVYSVGGLTVRQALNFFQNNHLKRLAAANAVDIN